MRINLVAAIAIPGLLRARMAGNEASAIGSLRAINSGQAAYSSSCAAGGYATTLADLVQGACRRHRLHQPGPVCQRRRQERLYRDARGGGRFGRGHHGGWDVQRVGRRGGERLFRQVGSADPQRHGHPVLRAPTPAARFSRIRLPRWPSRSRPPAPSSRFSSNGQGCRLEVQGSGFKEPRTLNLSRFSATPASQSPIDILCRSHGPIIVNN